MFFEHVKALVTRSKSISEQNLTVSGNIARLSAGFPSTYSGLKVKVSFGQGNWASITWIGFLTAGQAIQHGIYPVYLYYRDIDVLILAYGVSATNPPDIQWQIDNPETIGDYFKKNKINASGKYWWDIRSRKGSVAPLRQTLRDLLCIVSCLSAMFLLYL